MSLKSIFQIFETGDRFSCRGGVARSGCLFLFLATVGLVSVPVLHAQSPPHYEGTWQAPCSPVFPHRVARMAPVQSTPVDNSFPEQAVTRDSAVKPSNFEAGTSDTAPLTGTPPHTEALIDKVARVSSEYSDKAKKFFSGLFGSSGNSPDIPRMLGSLALVLGGYFAFVWVMRKVSPDSNGRLPQEVVQVLGVTHLGPRQTLQLVQLGSKLVLLLNGPDGTQPIGEITDPAEAEYLATLCGSRQASRFRLTSPQRQVPALREPTPLDPSTPGLANAIRTIENATRSNPGRAVFEA